MSKPTSETDTSRTKEQGGVQSVEVGLRILGVLISYGRPVKLKELADTADMPPAKVHRYLVSLTRARIVEQDQSGGRYKLGEFALTVGLAALAQLEVNEIAREAVADLRDRTEETSFLAVWGNQGATIVYLAEGRHAAASLARIGRVVSTVDSATGRTFSAYLPKELTSDAIARELKEKDRAWFREILDETRENGLGRTIGGEQTSINAICAPVFDHSEFMVAGITILGPARRFSTDPDTTIAKELKEVAATLSRRLGMK